MAKRELFGTDGIRKRVGEYPLTAETVLRLGQAAADAFLAREDLAASREWPKVIIGKDTRQSGDMLECAIAAGLNSRGIDVQRAGVIPTPGVAFLTKEKKAAFGVVISASHNPFYDNGIKFFGPDGYKLDDEFELEIEKRLLQIDGTERGSAGAIGRCASLENGLEEYINFVRHGAGEHDEDLLSGLHIALDCANGASYQSSVAILRSLGAKVSVYHDRPNGVNINEECGCTHTSVIESIMLESGADVGISHDGDADRVLLCDENGKVLDGDELMAICALAMLAEGTLSHNTLVATVMSNLGLDETLQQAGGKVERTDVGDRYVMERMKEGGFNFGGEQSGHFIFRDYNTTGDGIVSAVRILRVVQKSGLSLAELRKQFIRYPQVQRNVKVAEKPALDTLPSVDNLMSQITTELGDQGRILVRYSGTEPLLRILIEGKDEVQICRYADQLRDAVQAEIGA